MENEKLDKLINEYLASKKNESGNNLLPVSEQIKKMVENKVSVTAQVMLLKKAGIKTNPKRLREFVKSLSIIKTNPREV